ncbi:MAG: hypothetical protein KDG89_18340 [Geminicoccaceae bacterium]|nr:hypothetical protein [Geminicoccaceae bacterium]
MSESESSSSLPKGDTSSLPTGADNQPCFENQKAVNGKCVAQGQGGG